MSIIIVMYNAASNGSVMDTTRNIAEGLSSNGYDVWLASNTKVEWRGVKFKQVSYDSNIIFKVKQKINNCLKRFVPSAVRVFIDKETFLNQYYFALALRGLPRFWKEEVSVVMTPQHFCALGLGVMRKNNNIPYILIGHGDIFSHPKSSFPRPLYKFYEETARLAYRGANGVISVSNAIREVAISNGATSVKTIPNGVSLAEIRGPHLNVTLNMAKTNFCYVGRLSPEKGLDNLLQAISLIKRTNDYKLFIIGSGPEESNLKAYVERRGLESTVEFLGEVPRKELWYYYEVMQCLVLPSLSEAQGVVVLEAMLCKIPVIASDVGGVAEIVENGVNGILVKPNDAESLCVGMEKIMNGWRGEVPEWNEKNIQAYTWDNILCTYSRYLKDIEENYYKTISAEDDSTV